MNKGEPQLVWTRLVADLETPVSAMLKLSRGARPGQMGPMSFLLESVEGGAVRGRYSIIGLEPDIVWRAFGEKAEINRQFQARPNAFKAEKSPPLTSLRALLEESKIVVPDGLPPMAAGVFGYMGYDTVRLVEHLPDVKPDVLGVPDSILVRPTVMVIFDAVKDEMTVVTPVYPKAKADAKAAYKAAVERLAAVVAALEDPLPHMAALSTDALTPPSPRVEHERCRVLGDGRPREGVCGRRRRVPGGRLATLFGAVHAAAVLAVSGTPAYQSLAVPVSP